MTYKMHISVTIQYLSLPKPAAQWMKGTENNELNQEKIRKDRMFLFDVLLDWSSVCFKEQRIYLEFIFH